MSILKFSPPAKFFRGGRKRKTGPPPGGPYRDKFRRGADLFFAGGGFSGGDFILRHRRGDATVSRLSVRLSVCPSVTFKYREHIASKTLRK